MKTLLRMTGNASRETAFPILSKTRAHGRARNRADRRGSDQSRRFIIERIKALDEHVRDAAKQNAMAACS
ncbi:hypothetical protein JQK88_33845 [Mesorhizobium caraganae]|uniref:hypothetical protein n=1 Tax=Mesorhizobium caraganae TaxID=483206 RepID=UPI001786C5F2|nr:hypothetical protein [Mesorhizobium caraganae]MBM2716067.1 hypothetical protein [Mesorhizobium caraganae]